MSCTKEKDTNERYYNLIKNVGQLTNNNILLNTSLNTREMPIARLPQEALKVFYTTPLDAIFLGNNLLIKWNITK